MISIETIGWYSDDPGSQQYPRPLSAIYPSEGNFVGLVTDVRSRALVREVIACFRETTEFPSEGAALPESLPGVSWSDHWAFWQTGVPALMATDTAPFRYPHYHTPEDTPDRVHPERMAHVVKGPSGCFGTSRGRTERREPLPCRPLSSTMAAWPSTPRPRPIAGSSPSPPSMISAPK